MLVLMPTSAERTPFAVQHIYFNLRELCPEGTEFLIVEDASNGPSGITFDGAITFEATQGGRLRTALELASCWDAHEWVLIVEHDIVFTKETKELVEWLVSVPEGFGPEVVSVSGLYYDARGKLAYPAQKRWFGPEGEHSDCMKLMPPHNNVARAGAVPFACSLWRRTALESIRSSDPELYHLDTILGERLTAEGGWHIRCLDLGATHVRGVTFAQAKAMSED